MQSQAERFSAWFEKRRGRRNYEDEAALLLAAKAFDRIEHSSKVNREDLQTIVDAASHPHAMQWDGASDLLGMLATEFEEAAAAVILMLHSKKSHVRYAASCTLRKSTPEKHARSVVRCLLKDKSKKLRGTAALRIDLFNLTGSLSDLAGACRVENDPAAKLFMQNILDLHQNGYYLKSYPDGRQYIVVKSINGSPSRLLKPGELETKDPEAIAAEFRQSQKPAFEVR